MQISFDMRIRIRMRLGLALALAAVLLPVALSSSGDRHGSFLACKAACVPQCDEASIPAMLRLLAWDCRSQCDYTCSHQLTDASDEGKEYYHQFYGKWAFTRLFGMQEPASVLFSLGNLLVHYKGIAAVRRHVHKNNRLRNWLLLAGGIHVNTWLWSAVFHTRDLPWTERLDYFSATVTIGVTLLYAIVRIFGLQTPRSSSAALWPTTALVMLIVLGHFAYVSSLPLFPYGYHVAFAAVLGMVGNTLWILWSVSFVARPSIGGLKWPAPYPRTAKSDRDWTPALLTLLTICAMSLELLDFPPHWRILDAHALWHAATIPIGAAWWRFLIRDTNRLDTGLSRPMRD